MSFTQDLQKVLRQNVREYGMYIALFVIMAIFTVATNGLFISPRNIANLINQTPMNQIPTRLAELDKDEEWVVVCAHGNRSYSVAGYLIVNGYKASSLAGGVTDWWMRGGETESDLRR